MDIVEHLKDGVEVIEVSLGDTLAVKPLTLRMDRAYCGELRSSREIALAVEKRFKGRGVLQGNLGYLDVVSWCLSTDGFKVRAENLKGVSDEEIEVAWQFIDTMSVSSTRECRDLIARGKGSRSSLGFSRTLRSPQLLPRRGKRGGTLGGPPVQVAHDPQSSEGYETVELAMVEECMSWVARSPDPIGLCSTLSSRILERNKSVHYP